MKKTSKHNLATDAVEIIHRRYYDGRPQRMAGLAEAEANGTVAREICELRKRAALTQQQLAKLAGTTTSVICRLEDADYEGHSLTMLRRIAKALKQAGRAPFRQCKAEAKSRIAVVCWPGRIRPATAGKQRAASAKTTVVEQYEVLRADGVKAACGDANLP